MAASVMKILKELSKYKFDLLGVQVLCKYALTSADWKSPLSDYVTISEDIRV
jgi:hypothetical protein